MEGHDQTDTPTIEVKGRAARKPKGKAAAADKGKRSLNLSLSPEVYERLFLHSLADNKTISELVSELAVTHLRRVHMVRTQSKSDAA